MPPLLGFRQFPSYAHDGGARNRRIAARMARTPVVLSGPVPISGQTTRRIVFSLTLNRAAISGIGRISTSRIRLTSTR